MELCEVNFAICIITFLLGWFMNHELTWLSNQAADHTPYWVHTHTSRTLCIFGYVQCIYTTCKLAM